MKSYILLLIWIILGAIIGLIIYPFFQPTTSQITPNPVVPVIENQSVPVQNLTPIPEKSPVVLVLLNAPCSECNFGDMGIQQAITIISESEGLSLSSVQNISYPSEEAEILISKYKITELPCLLVLGDTSADPSFVELWNTSAGTVESDGTLVSRSPYPPFFDIADNKAKGLISGIAIQSNCTVCLNAEDFIPPLEDYSIGMIFTNKTILNESDPQAQLLIEKYNITTLPVLLLSQDAEYYPIFQQLSTLGSVESDGWFVLRNIKPPFVELPSHEIRGILDVIYVYNSSCRDCFNVQEFGSMLSQSYGLYIENQSSYDSNSSEAKLLIDKYHLTALPAILYSPESFHYSAFQNIWLQLNNSVESDGWFVFRNYEILNKTYQNITVDN